MSFLICLTAVQAQEHTRFVDQPLDLLPDELVDALQDKGLQQEDRYELSGRIAGLDVWLYVNVSKDSTKINHVLSIDVNIVGGQYESYCLLVHANILILEGGPAYSRLFQDIGVDFDLAVRFTQNNQKRSQGATRQFRTLRNLNFAPAKFRHYTLRLPRGVM